LKDVDTCQQKMAKVATANLRPRAARMANDVLNETPGLQTATQQSPLQVFADTKVNPNAKHWKPFGCPACVLDSNLQAGKIHHNWKQRSRVGVHADRSPQHARNAALVLNIETGPVSPQFHAKFDLSFHTVKQRPEMESLWQIKARFVAQRRPTPEPTKTNLKEIGRPAEGAPTGAPQPKQKRPRTADQKVPKQAVRFN
jgi:hypothetical protein